MLSSHIPDPDLITYHAENTASAFSRMSPWAKLSALFLVILFITLTRNVIILCIIYAAALLIYRSSGLPVRRLFGWYLFPVLFVVSLIGIMIWNEPGVPLISFGDVLTLTDNGLLLITSLTLKTLISVTFSLLFPMTTRYSHLSAMIYRLFPTPVDRIFLMAYRFIFIMLAMVASLVKAIRSRGGGFIQGIRNQSRLYAGVFALVFIRTYDRAERVDKAMQARGYSGVYASYSEIPGVTGREAAELFGAVLAFACLVLVFPG